MNKNTRHEKPSFIPFARPSMGMEEKKAVLEVMESGWLTSGSRVESFERNFADYIGSPFARAVNSATAGLHLSLEAAGIREGSRIITTPYTFTSSAEVLRYLGAHPLFVDIDRDTLNIDARKAIETLEKHSKDIGAILPVHLAGRICDIDTLTDAARCYGIPVIEDTAHAFPVKHRGKFAGTFGTTGVFSFYATKTITTGEGGMVVTDSEEIARRIGIMRLHGIDREAWDRYTTSRQKSWEYDIVAAGFKYNLSDLAAAIGIEQLKKADTFLARRRTIAEYYTKNLADQDYLILPGITDEHAWHLYIIRIRPDMLTIDRDAFCQALLERGIGTSIHYKPLHMMTYYRNLYGYKSEDFPVCLEVFNTCISLPLYPDLEEEEIERIVQAICSIGSASRR